MGFRIRHQQGSIINNVTGGQTVVGGQTAGSPGSSAAVPLHHLEAALADVPLPRTTARTIHEELTAIRDELAGPSADRSSVAGRLTRITQHLASAGALAAAGNSLITPLSALATWLGTLGDPIHRILASIGGAGP
ncbi:hypothetical protein ADK86_25510 [Streptomyces sp. NRRL F-5755]|uniref:hypothetical protein n=1 Tax=Streptomyces sp. NRRL F-5755 TaxID=1519475 RepID=UPI0006B034D3|nr:hypothetical protein [Streptomyces sp. NRRL F-5755]KOT90708.1 hypothetical protein ADK86_25510 [Streptomyces sp. NRRL F-5755]